MRNLRWAGLLVCITALTVPAAFATDPSLNWHTLQSEHFRLHFPDGAETMARRAATLAERSHAELSPKFGWTPRRRTDIVLRDDFDLANGFASPLPFNHIHLYASAPDDLHRVPDFDDWLELLIHHEYVHTLHLDKAGGDPQRARHLFGRHPLLFPNLYQPVWLIEGLATYYETDHERGVGRGQSSLYAMKMRMQVMAGIQPMDRVGMSGVTTWPGGSIPYLYGVHFFDFVEQRYGADAVMELVGTYSHNLLPFRVQGTFERVLGVRGERLWAQFGDYLEQRYRPTLEAVAAAGTVGGNALTDHGYYSGPVIALADGGAYYIRNDARRRPMLIRLSADGERREIARVRSGARLDVHPQAGALVAQPELCGNDKFYYDLYRIDPAGGDSRRLTRCGRYRYGAWHPDGQRIFAAGGELGQSRLELLDAEGRQLEVLWQGEPDAVLGQLDVAADGEQLVAALWRPGRGWGIERYSLAERRWETLLADGALIGEPRYTADAGGVLFSSDHGGVFNIRRLDLASGNIETLTNVAGGAFLPSQARADEIYYVGYGARGYDIYRLAPGDTARPLPDAPPARPVRSQPEPAGGTVRPYRPWNSLRPHAWTPMLLLDEGRSEFGAYGFGMDALRLHEYSASLSYESQRGLWNGGVNYGYHQRYRLFALREHRYDYSADRTLDGVARVDRLQGVLTQPLRRLDFALAGHLGLGSYLERPLLANGSAGADSWHENFVGLALSFDNSSRFRRAISRSDGRQLRLTAETGAVLGGEHDGQSYRLDWREFLALGGDHVLGLRLMQGWNQGRTRPFRLGSASESELAAPDRAALFNRRQYPLRGYPLGLDSLRGQRSQLASIEWRAPLGRLERGLLYPPAGLNTLSARAFVDVGAAWDSGPLAERYFTGSGLELLAETSIFYHVLLQLRLGLAHGHDRGGETQVYLALGPAF